MDSGELVAFDDTLLRPHGDALTRLVDGLADIDARRPGPDRFASEVDEVRFEVMKSQLRRMLSGTVSPDERRGHARIPCDLWVRVSHRGRVKPGVIDDLGAGGVFVSTLLRPEIGDRVHLIMEPTDVITRPIRIASRVAWLGSETRAGFGAAFDFSAGAASVQVDVLVLALLQHIAPTLS